MKTYSRSAKTIVDKYIPQRSGYSSTAAFNIGSSTISLTFLRYNSCILINKEGTYFVNELAVKSVLETSIKESTDGSTYVVVDQTLVDSSSQVQGFIKTGYFQKAETIETYQTAVETDNNAQYSNTMVRKWISSLLHIIWQGLLLQIRHHWEDL